MASDRKRKPRMMKCGSPEYERQRRELLESRAPEIYPCAKCGGPVMDGYCCTRCGTDMPESNNG